MPELVDAEKTNRNGTEGIVLTWKVKGTRARAKVSARIATVMRFPKATPNTNIISIEPVGDVKNEFDNLSRGVWRLQVFFPTEGIASAGLKLPD